MPKSTHFHQVHDAQITDKKFRPEDEGIYQEEKHELQESEQDKKAEPVSEEEFIAEQDRKAEAMSEDEVITEQDKQSEG